MKWFDLDDQLSTDERNELARSFLTESEVVADLRTNPLMLALMCNIYKGENYIPANRPDVYEKCAMMMFERWDASRNIRYGLPFESLLRPAMMHLAYCIYSDPALQAGVTRRTLEHLATEYLLDRRFDDFDEARSAAVKFVEFCTGRAWVLIEVGLSSDDEPLYQFTHQTFLEYFTAGHLVRQNPTPESLLPVLAPRIARSEWDVVAQLSVQIQNRNVEAAGEDLLTALLDLNQADVRSSINTAAFCVRCLEFLVPRVGVTRSVVQAATSLTLDLLDEVPRSAAGGSPEIDPPLNSLAACASENVPTVKRALAASVDEGLSAQRRAAGLLFWELPDLFREEGKFEVPAGPQRQHLLSLAEADPRQAISCLEYGVQRLPEATTQHGYELLFVNPHLSLLAAIGMSLAGRIISFAAWGNASDSRHMGLAEVALDFHSLTSQNIFPLPVSEPPWEYQDIVRGEMRYTPISGGAAPSHVIEAGAVLLAVLYSLGEAANLRVKPGPKLMGRLDFMRRLFDVRSGATRKGTGASAASRAVDGLSEPVAQVLLAWARNELDLISYEALAEPVAAVVSSPDPATDDPD